MALTKFLKLFLPSIGDGGESWSTAASQINQNFTTIDNHFYLLSKGFINVAASGEVLYGITAVEASHTSNEATAKASAVASFNSPDGINEKHPVSFQSGALVDFDIPDPIGFYRVWIALRDSIATNVRFYNQDNLSDLHWVRAADQMYSPEETVESYDYQLWVRTVPYNHSETAEFIVRTFS